jgi:hypothetical protein
MVNTLAAAVLLGDPSRGAAEVCAAKSATEPAVGAGFGHDGMYIVPRTPMVFAAFAPPEDLMVSPVRSVGPTGGFISLFDLQLPS